MKKFIILILLLNSIVFSKNTLINNEINNQEMDSFISDLVSKMTVEEKVGQMTQIAIQAVSKQPRTEGDKLEINVDKLRKAIKEYNIGSFLESGGGANSIEEWHKLITLVQDISLKETRLGIPNLYGIDAIHGANFTTGATLFPQAIAMGATRNIELMKESASITALEVRASGIAWNFNPVLGVGREPLWPRMWETFGEDTYLVSQFGKAYVEGLQGANMGDERKVAACIKHYLGYSVPKNGRDRTPAWIPERMMREIFLPSFVEAIDAGAETIMINSGEINGIPTHSDKFILTDLLKGELGFKGFTVSDWEDVIRLHIRDGIASTPKEAVRIAVMAGIDMSMVPLDYSFYTLLVELVKEGAVPISRIDDAVYRILRVKYLTGLFDNPYPNKELVSEFATKRSTQSNLDAAREAITLLENKNSTLPLSKSNKILVAGPNANLLSVMNGGWTITWQGNNESLYPKEKFTILEAIQEKIGKENVKYLEGTLFDKDINTSEVVKQAKDADAVVLVLGEMAYCEFKGSINDLNLPEAQLNLAKEVYTTGKPVVLVIVGGRPRIINKIVDDAEAIVMAYLPGMEGGKAIADVLFGDVNPSGKLPFSYPKYANAFNTYDHKPSAHYELSDNIYDPQWAFGHGLSYTQFEYSNLTIDNSEYRIGENISVSVEVTNTGKIEGKESVELFISDIFASVSRPTKLLKRFKKINLKPGEKQIVTFELDENDLSFIGRENKRIVEPGEFKIIIEKLEESFVLKKNYESLMLSN